MFFNTQLLFQLRYGSGSLKNMTNMHVPPLTGKLSTLKLICGMFCVSEKHNVAVQPILPSVASGNVL